MSHREIEDNYTPEQEDFVAGRLEHQKKAALIAKKTRQFIAAHPGCTTFDVRLKLGNNIQLDWLLKRGLVSNLPGQGLRVVPL